MASHHNVTVSSTLANLLLPHGVRWQMATYIVTAKLLNKTEIVYTALTENMLKNEAIENFKQFHAEQHPEVDLTNAQISCVLAP